MYAIIDLGSNTVRMNIYKVRKKNLKLKSSFKETISLAAYLDGDVLSDDGIAVAVKTVNQFLKQLKDDRIKKTYLIATATLRKAKNHDQFFAAIKHHPTLEIHLLSGPEEAEYDFHAVHLEQPDASGIVVDIGGGSTEIITYQDGKILSAEALTIGSLSAYMENVDKLIPNLKEQKKIKKRVRKELDQLAFVIPQGPMRMHGVGGTLRATKKFIDKAPITKQAQWIDLRQIKPLIEDLTSMEKAAYLKIIRTVPERIHTISTGLVILDTIHEYFQVDSMRVFTQGVREGFIVKNLERDFPELKPLQLKL